MFDPYAAARTCLRSLLFAASCTMIVPAAFAQDAYPSKPIKLVIPFGAGGITDVVGRLIGQQLGDELKQPVVIENKPGAGGSIAAQLVAQAPADGYTMLLGTVGVLVVNQMLYSRLQYQADRDFAPVSLLSNSPYMLAVHPSIPAKDLPGFVKHVKENPGKLAMGSAGNGSAPHLSLELLKLSAGLDIMHVPYKSGGEAVNAALGNHVQMVIDAIPVVAPQVQANRLTGIALADAARHESIPAIGTSLEQGLGDFQVGSWNALVVPAGTPQSVIDTLAAAVAKTLARPEVKSKLASMGINPMQAGADAFRKHVDAEKERWTRITKAAGTRLD